jgi:hypothetical protein
MSHIRRLATAQDGHHQSQPTFQEEAITAAATKAALIDLLESVAGEQPLLCALMTGAS